MGDYRRKLHGAQLPANFFDHSNEEFMAKRLQACDMALEDLTEFMKQDGVRVGVLDSTNSNHARRTHIRDALKSLECKVVVLESICDKEDVRNEWIFQHILLLQSCTFIISNFFISDNPFHFRF